MDIQLYDDVNYYTMYPHADEQIAWEYDQLRYGDQCASIAYAFGFKSFTQIRDLLRFEGIGRGIEPKVGANSQILPLWGYKTRTPKSILEIGGGRGEICVVLSHLGIKCQMVEPSRACMKLVERTREKFGMFEAFDFYNMPISGAVNFIDWSDIDTIILCETLEHIEAYEFDQAYESYVKPTLKKNSGYLIVTNWIDYHPIPLVLPYHCRMIDDELFDRFCGDGKKVYRDGSHLVVEYSIEKEDT